MTSLKISLIFLSLLTFNIGCKSTSFLPNKQII